MFGQRFITYTPPLQAPSAPAMMAGLRSYLGVSGSSEDSYLASLLSTGISHAELYCNRVFVPRGIVEIDPVVRGTQLYTLRHCPIITLTEISIGGVIQSLADFYMDVNTGALQAKATAPDTFSNFSSWANALPDQAFGAFVGEVKITYSAGYATIPAGVQNAVFEMCKIMRSMKDRDPNIGREEVPDVGSVEYLGFRGSTAQTSEVASGTSGGLPPAFALVSGLLTPFRRHVS